jgi:hypothetical protein
MTLLIIGVLALVALWIVVKILRFLFSSRRGPALPIANPAEAAAAAPKLKSPLDQTGPEKARSWQVSEDQRKRAAEQAAATARARAAQALEDQRRRAADWARNPINPMNPNSRLNPANPMNPNNPINPSNPMNPINRNRR